MAFLVYLFVLVVAAGSIVFGLDLTQSPLQPPSYATANTTTGSAPAPATAPTARGTAAPLTTARASAPAKAPSVDVAAARAQATPEESQAQTTASVATAANRCAVDACAAAYHSFRAADCTYQPFGGERRICTKGATTKKIAVARPSVVHRASRPADLRRVHDRRYAERDNNRDSYDEPRHGWVSDLFGDAFGR